MSKPIEFHWRLIQGGEGGGLSRSLQLETDSVALPDVAAQAAFCQKAEQAGMESLLTDISYGKPDPLLLASSIVPHTEKIKFLVAIRSSLISPTYFVQQVNTFSAFSNGRILLNVVAGHSPQEQGYYGDFLPHDERYARTEEFLAICNAFWDNSGPVNFNGQYYKIVDGRIRTPFVAEHRDRPYTFIGGGSDAARNLAISQGSCWMRLPDTPEKIKADAQPVLAAGKEVGLRLSIFSRKTKKEAIEAAYQFVGKLNHTNKEGSKEKKFVNTSDSVMMSKMYDMAEKEWLTPWLWTGAVRTHGAPAIAFIGTPEEIADAIMLYKEAGVTQYIISGWPKTEEMIFFGKEIIPLVRVERKNG